MCIPGFGIAVLAVPAPVVHSELLAAISQGIPSREKFAIWEWTAFRWLCEAHEQHQACMTHNSSAGCVPLSPFASLRHSLDKTECGWPCSQATETAAIRSPAPPCKPGSHWDPPQAPSTAKRGQRHRGQPGPWGRAVGPAAGKANGYKRAKIESHRWVHWGETSKPQKTAGKKWNLSLGQCSQLHCLPMHPQVTARQAGQSCTAWERDLQQLIKSDCSSALTAYS